MGTIVPWHRTITINCGSSSIYTGLHEKKSAKAKNMYKCYTKKDIQKGTIWVHSPPFLDQNMACKDI